MEKTIEIHGNHDRPKLEVLLDGGPLCVAHAYDWTENRERRDLFRIYHKKLGMSMGPFYVSLSLADAGMKKAIKLGRHIWDDVHTLAEEKWIHKWIDEQLGKAGVLVGGTWTPDPEEAKGPVP